MGWPAFSLLLPNRSGVRYQGTDEPHPCLSCQSMLVNTVQYMLDLPLGTIAEQLE